MPLFTKANHLRISRSNSFVKIMSAPMSFRSCVDGGAVYGKERRRATLSKQQLLVGEFLLAAVDAKSEIDERF